jgi:hypothetical protein
MKPKANFTNRQAREYDALLALYAYMPTVGTEARFMSSGKFAHEVKMGVPFIDAAVRTYEKCGILTRRLEFGAMDATGRKVNGRSYHWTLLMGREDGLAALDKQHKRERDALKPPTLRKDSLKARVLAAVTEYQHFETTSDLVKVVRRDGDNIDLHNMTHVMESLAKEGRINFDRGSTKDRIPYNIRLSKNGAKTLTLIQPEEIVMEASDIIENNEEPTPLIIQLPNESTNFPTIERLIKRRTWLETAASLAENAEEDDLAISLLDRANKPLTPLEAEAVRLYEVYLKDR